MGPGSEPRRHRGRGCRPPRDARRPRARERARRRSRPGTARRPRARRPAPGGEGATRLRRGRPDQGPIEDAGLGWARRTRRARAAARAVIIYGRNPVREALRGRRSVNRIWATKNTLREDWLVKPGLPVIAAAAEEIERRSGSEAHQGVCAEV